MVHCASRIASPPGSLNGAQGDPGPSSTLSPSFSVNGAVAR